MTGGKAKGEWHGASGLGSSTPIHLPANLASAENRIAECSTLNGTSVPTLSRRLLKRGYKVIHQRQWMTTSKRCFPVTTEQMHIWTHSDYDSLQRTWSRSRKTKSPVGGEEKWAWSPTHNWGHNSILVVFGNCLKRYNPWYVNHSPEQVLYPSLCDQNKLNLIDLK